jgi:hypothetical protein
MPATQRFPLTAGFRLPRRGRRIDRTRSGMDERYSTASTEEAADRYSS